MHHAVSYRLKLVIVTVYSVEGVDSPNNEIVLDSSINFTYVNTFNVACTIFKNIISYLVLFATGYSLPLQTFYEVIERGTVAQKGKL